MSKPFDEPFVRIRGRVTRRGDVRFSPAIRTARKGRTHSGPGWLKRTGTIEPGEDDLIYRVEIQGPAGQVLQSEYIAIHFETNGHEWGRFGLRLPFHPTAQRIALFHGDRELGALTVPQHTPEFSLTLPSPTDTISPNSVLHLEWQPEGVSASEALTYFVRFSPDGRRWHRVGVNLRTAHFNLDLRALEGGAHCRVQVLATNGYHTSFVETAPFALPARSPQVFLGDSRGPVLFAQGFSQLHGPLTGDTIVWSVGGKEVGRGGSLDVRRLGPGVHAIRVRVQQPDGQAIESEVGDFDGRTGRRKLPRIR